MADVSRPRERRERAQLILVSGLLIAVTLLLLVLLLNTVIFTDNVATRGIDSDAGEAIDYQRMLQTELPAHFEAENARSDGDDWEPFEENVTAGVDHILAHREARALEHGRMAESNVTLVRGLYAEQEETAPIGNITIAEEAVQSRNFTVTVEEDSLDVGDTFEIRADDGNWQLIITKEAVGDETIMTGVPSLDACEAETFSGDLTIDLIAETVVDDDEDEHSCDGDFWGDEGAPPDVGDSFDIEFEDSLTTGVEGTFRLETEVTEDETYDHPDAVPIVYGADVELTYRSADLRYATTVVVEGPVP